MHDTLGKRYNSLTFKPSLVHRIDRDTSGCLIVALQKPILEKLLAELQNHKIEKIYHAVVFGKMPKPRGTIDVKLLRKEDAKDEAKVIVSDRGQRAVTHYRTLKEFSVENENFSLLECQIETGRTHQIRVHLAHLGCPILGDVLYGGAAAARVFLHAQRLVFVYQGEQMDIRADAPPPWPAFG